MVAKHGKLAQPRRRQCIDQRHRLRQPRVIVNEVARVYQQVVVKPLGQFKEAFDLGLFASLLFGRALKVRIGEVQNAQTIPRDATRTVGNAQR